MQTHPKTHDNAARKPRAGSCRARARFSTVIRLSLFSILGLQAFGLTAPAATVTWKNGTTGNWANTSSWTLGSIPGADDDVYTIQNYTQYGHATIDSGSWFAKSVNVGLYSSGSGGSTASSLLLTGSASSLTLTNGVSLGSGSITVTGGASLRSGSGDIGMANAYESTMTVSGSGTTWTITNGLTLGNTAAGTTSTQGHLNILDGAAVSANSLLIGASTAKQSTFDITLRGIGSSLTLGSGQFYMGGGSSTQSATSSQTFTIEQGARFSSNFGIVVVAHVGSSSIRVTGEGSEWVNATTLTVGDTDAYATPGSALVQITDGGRVSSSSFSLIKNGRLEIGSGGTLASTLTVASGAALHLADGAVFEVGLDTLSSSAITLDSGSTLTVADGASVLFSVTGGELGGSYTLLSSVAGTLLDTVSLDTFNVSGDSSAFAYGLTLSGSSLILNITAAAVPEPATVAALFGGLALAGVLIVRRRQTKAA